MVCNPALPLQLTFLGLRHPQGRIPGGALGSVCFGGGALQRTLETVSRLP